MTFSAVAVPHIYVFAVLGYGHANQSVKHYIGLFRYKFIHLTRYCCYLNQIKSITKHILWLKPNQVSCEEAFNEYPFVKHQKKPDRTKPLHLLK